ncbi:MAG TPA: type II toxin-antitoxin system Phd/YefM family antitoxin [Pirellulaceae bacterium]|nr:type II toxin-antitoxin system Phd/YefM family antitoxin [Pirellulaceae bacterium]
MNLSITEDFRPLSELERAPLTLVEQARATGRPVIVTAEGKPDVVILSAEAFQRQVALVNLAALLAEGEADVKHGRTRRAREFFKELRGGKTKARR